MPPPPRNYKYGPLLLVLKWVSTPNPLDSAGPVTDPALKHCEGSLRPHVVPMRVHFVGWRLSARGGGLIVREKTRCCRRRLSVMRSKQQAWSSICIPHSRLFSAFSGGGWALVLNMLNLRFMLGLQCMIFRFSDLEWMMH